MFATTVFQKQLSIHHHMVSRKTLSDQQDTKNRTVIHRLGFIVPQHNAINNRR